MPFSCIFCSAITETTDVGEKNIRCNKCGNITLHPREHNKLVNTDMDAIEFTIIHFPKIKFKDVDREFIYCRFRGWSCEGFWCNKFTKPCIGSCEWKREQEARKKEPEMTDEEANLLLLSLIEGRGEKNG